MQIMQLALRGLQVRRSPTYAAVPSVATDSPTLLLVLPNTHHLGLDWQRDC